MKKEEKPEKDQIETPLFNVITEKNTDTSVWIIFSFFM